MRQWGTEEPGWSVVPVSAASPREVAAAGGGGAEGTGGRGVQR